MRTLPIESLLDAVGGARLVLLGEGSHGTQEFYRVRAELTQALMEGERLERAIGVIYRPQTGASATTSRRGSASSSMR